MNALSGRVLVLNASYEVLGTVGIARAMLMVLRDKDPVAIEEVVPNRFLRSGGGKSWEVPSVIRLKNYVNVNKKRRDTSGRRTRIYIRDGYKCQYCSVKVGQIHPITRERLTVQELTLDHITPRAQNGGNEPHNLVTACKPCNNRKADRTPEQARMPLITEMHEDRNLGMDKLLICHYAESRPEWLPYLQEQEGFKEILEKLQSIA